MFPKKNRITKTGFDELLKKGRVLHSSFFSLRYLKNKATPPKFAFVVSKKVAKKAVDRNVLRRRGFSALRELNILKEKNKWAGFSVVFFFKKEGKEVTQKEIKGEMEELFKKIGLV